MSLLRVSTKTPKSIGGIIHEPSKQGQLVMRYSGHHVQVQKGPQSECKPNEPKVTLVKGPGSIDRPKATQISAHNSLLHKLAITSKSTNALTLYYRMLHHHSQATLHNTRNPEYYDSASAHHNIGNTVCQYKDY